MLHSSTININSEVLIKWMNVIRNTDGDTQYRLLENFWGSQIRSKAWLVNELKQLFPEINGNVYIFGGWYGVLAQLVHDNFSSINSIYSIDNDFTCVQKGYMLCSNPEKIIFVCSNMEDYTTYVNPGLIINTSTEHVSQEIFDSWKSKLPINTPIVLQGNNLFDCDDHIRCHNNLDEFNLYNQLDKIFFTDELLCDYHFKRFMTIGYKNE